MTDDKEKAHIDPFGFREYDARWLYPKDINAEGLKTVGLGLGGGGVRARTRSAGGFMYGCKRFGSGS